MTVVWQMPCELVSRGVSNKHA